MTDKIMRALLIEFNLNTGQRAGGIDPHDPKLQCYGWQDLESNPALELRIIEDNRTIIPFFKGITLIEGKDAINAAIKTHFKSKFKISDQVIYAKHINSTDINFNELPDDDQDRLKYLKKIGIKGISEKRPRKI